MSSYPDIWDTYDLFVGSPPFWGDDSSWTEPDFSSQDAAYAAEQAEWDAEVAARDAAIAQQIAEEAAAAATQLQQNISISLANGHAVQLNFADGSTQMILPSQVPTDAKLSVVTGSDGRLMLQWEAGGLTPRNSSNYASIPGAGPEFAGTGDLPSGAILTPDAHVFNAVRSGVVDAKTTVYGPISVTEADRMNKYLATQTSIANANAGAAAGVATSSANPWVGVIVGYGVSASGPYPSRPELREGDILVITSGNTYLRRESGIPVGSFLDVRAVNQNLTFINETGMTRFEGTPARLLYETSASIPAGASPGLRIYKDANGVIQFAPIY